MRLMRLLIGICFVFLFLGGCGSKNEPNPNDSLDSYLKFWNNQDFEQMYHMLTEDSKQKYSNKDFIDRYEKVYEDLSIKEIEITPSALTDEEIQDAIENKKAQFTLDISMDSIAGSIHYEREMDLTLNKQEDKDQTEEWEINWDEGFILPGLENGGKVSIEKESPRRGEILDRNQMPLAINDTAYEVGVIPDKFNAETKDIESLAQLLQISKDNIEEQLNASWVQPDLFVPLKKIAITQESLIDQVLEIPGVTTKETTGRVYPSGEAAAHVTGYIGKITKEELDEYPKGVYDENDVVGKRGLEKLYEEKLHGEEGVRVLLVTENENGTENKDVIVEKPVQHGERVQLSIDINIQEKIFNTFEDNIGTAAAIDPKTGEVLALVNNPSFDPNELSYGISQSKWDQIMDDEDQPFLNRFASTFAPGSSLKPITAAVGLKNGTITHDEGIEINGLTWGKKSWGGQTVTRVSTSGKPVTLQNALTRSDNIYFAMKAVEMGSDQYIEGLKYFGFEDEMPTAFPIETSQISNDGKLDEILLAHTSYGQGEIEVSPLHLALAYTPFINDGNMIKPSFLHDDPQGEVWKERVISKEDADKMADYLSDVVSEGTAKSAKDKKLAISGKTGTAELKLAKDSKGHQNGWFVGYPTEDEDILIAMMMEKVENDGSSSYVAGKVKDALKEIKK